MTKQKSMMDGFGKNSESSQKLELQFKSSRSNDSKPSLGSQSCNNKKMQKKTCLWLLECNISSSHDANSLCFFLQADTRHCHCGIFGSNTSYNIDGVERSNSPIQSTNIISIFLFFLGGGSPPSPLFRCLR